MKRLCVLGVLSAILLAGGANGFSIPITNKDEGDHHILSVITFGADVQTCYLTTPHNDTVYFKPGDDSQSTEKYHIDQGQPGYIDCMLTINDLDKDDEGIWVISYNHSSGQGRNQTYNITVNVAEPKEESEDIDAQFLSTINHFTRQGMLIDISLDTKKFEEDCYVRPPNGTLTKAIDLKMENVTVQYSSAFVSCRITIGPMSQELLGEWILCGKSMEDNQMRCQAANITWNNNNANAVWQNLVQPRFPHPVHYGGSVNPGVQGTGEVITCHVVTPSGEDLVITNNTKYSNIERIAFNNPSLCSINISDINRDMIANWSVYGKFRSSLGLNEVQLPLNFFLYNEQDPFEQAYNVTVLPEETILVNLRTSVEVEVSSSGAIDDCRLRTPAGQNYDLTSAEITEGVVLNRLETRTACNVTINPVTEERLGEWQIIGKFSNGNQFTERRQTFKIILEDPENPIIDEDRVVENLTERVVDSSLGASHRITIADSHFIANESCHIVTPNGSQYAFIQGFNVPNVQIIHENGVECGVIVDLLSEDMLGEWTLIARGNRFSTPIERRQSFTIRIEETFSLGNTVNITEGADLYLRLPKTTHLYETCKLYGPDDEEVTSFETDPVHPYSCSYIVRSVTRSQSGTWTIFYGNGITYRGTVKVNVLESHEVSVDDIVLTSGTSVNTTVGPENAVYCKIEDPSRFTVFDGFGPCTIVIDRVTTDFKGTWRMSVGVPGTVLLQVLKFYVDVQSADSRPVVTSSVESINPSIVLTCSVPVQYTVQACKFRNALGQIILASHGVGQNGTVAKYESDANSHNCTVRLSNPSVNGDLGLWRCAVETDQGTYFGFMSVLAPWLNNEVQTEPELRAERSFVASLEGNAAVMSCSINSVIRYCYFRAPNGTVFNVGPSITSPNYAYVGSGFDAGECGIRFNSLYSTDSGQWRCQVGLADITAEEKSDSWFVEIQEKISVVHYLDTNTDVIVHSYVHNALPLDYCRYVRIDGMGFTHTSPNLPVGYHVLESRLASGECILRISNPDILDMHPWTVVAKITGYDGEVSKSTMDTLLIAPPVDNMPQNSFGRAIFLWISVTMFCVLLISICTALIPEKNRKWTYDRVSGLRNSFRKQPPSFNVIIDLPQKV